MDFEGVLQLAPGRPRTLAFGSSVRKDLRLLELDEALLQELLQAGLNIKGEEGSEAVLCTQTKTYSIKTVETTNSVWLVKPSATCAKGEGAHDGGEPVEPQSTPPGQLIGLATQLNRNQAAAANAPVVVAAVASSHLEVVPAAPRLDVLDAMLQERPYGQEGDGMEVDGEPAGYSGRYTREELLQRVQASPAELDQALRDRHALCLDGRYSSVDPEYLGTLLEVLLLLAVERGWAGDHVIPADAAAAALAVSGYDPRVVKHCLQVYGSRIEEGTAASPSPPEGSGGEDPVLGADGGTGTAACGGLWQLGEAAVCCHFARKLLGEQAQWGESEFLEAWREAVPQSMTPQLRMLRGEALVCGRRIKRFSAAALPADAAGRFEALFGEREMWTWEDLEPYVTGLQGPGQTVEGLLLKYARASQHRPTDPILYSGR